MTSLIITEKQTVATSIADAFGWKKSPLGYEGVLNGKKYNMVWARGHLLSFMEPDEVTPGLGWNSPANLVPIARNVPHKPTEEKGVQYERSLAKRLDIIKKGLSTASEVILATDPDREGEYIGWSVLEYLKCTLPVKRLWLGAGMDAKSITQAMNNLKAGSETKPFARAAEARARCDWAYMYIVRLMTYYGRQGHLGNHLGTGERRSSVVSLGRVQTAALYMIYKREMEIRHFVPKTFYNFLADFSVVGNLIEKAEYKPTVTREIIELMPPGVTWEPQGLDGENKLDRPLFTGVQECAEFEKRIQENKDKAYVLKYDTSQKSSHPKITFDLVAAKSALISVCKIKGDLAQVIIEDLYEQGYISYPRTAHGELPMNLYEKAERESSLQAVIGIPQLSQAAQRAIDIHAGNDPQYQPFKPKAFVTKKLEHYGLIPTGKKVTQQVFNSMQPKKMHGNAVKHTSAQMQQAYLLIAERYVQALLPPAQIAKQTITFAVPAKDMLGHEESVFVASAEQVIDPGWMAIIGVQTKAATTLPTLKKGTPSPLTKLRKEESKTKCPSRYTDANFEKAMQNAAREVNDPELRKYMMDNVNKPEGIGTPATRKDILPTLMAREYIKGEKSAIMLCPKGEELINYLTKNGHHSMYRIETTAEWEARLADMVQIEDDRAAVAERDKFVEQTYQDLEGFIRAINDKYLGKQADTSHRVLPITPKVKEIIKSIAERKGIKLAPDVLKDPAKAKAFLEEHYPKKPADGSAGSSTPSDAQLAFLKKVEEASGVKAPEEILADRSKLSAFIEQHKKALDKQPPSEKMISFAKSLAAKLPADKQPKPSVFTSMAECKKFIEKHKTK